MAVPAKEPRASRTTKKTTKKTATRKKTTQKVTKKAAAGKATQKKSRDNSGQIPRGGRRSTVASVERLGPRSPGRNGSE